MHAGFHVYLFVESKVVKKILHVNNFAWKWHFNMTELDEFVPFHQTSYGSFTFRCVIPLHS
jgi:hypothetical protein